MSSFSHLRINATSRILRTFCILGLLFILPGASSLVAETVAFGFNSTILAGVTMTDAESALALWADFVGKEEGIQSESKVSGYKHIENLVADLQTEKLDVAMLTAFDYLKIRDRVGLEVISVGVIAERIDAHMLLIVHRNGTAKTIEDLKGKTILNEFSYAAHVGEFWLEATLAARNLPPPPQFFGTRKTMEKVSLAVLPVFFRKADACLVRESALKTMIELNPQLGRDLVVIASSPPILNGLCAIRPGMNATHREILIRRIPTMHQHIRGKQILMLLKLEQATTFSPDMLKTTEALFNECNRIKVTQGKESHTPSVTPRPEPALGKP